MTAAANTTELAQLRAELEHAKAALAGDNEGIRLWMLDCTQLADKHRTRAEAAEAERDELHAALGLARGQLHSAALSAIHGRGTNIRELQQRAEQAEAANARVRDLAADMRDWCSPYGIAVDYADRIHEALDGAEVTG